MNKPIGTVLGKAYMRLWMKYRYLKSRLVNTALGDSQLYRAFASKNTLEECVRKAGRQIDTRFFIDVKKKDKIMGEFKQLYPEAESSDIGAANKFCNHIFNLLGSGEVNLGRKIDWNRDFISGRKWPLKHYSCINELQSENHSDIKVPWELSRCYHFITLGKAYWHTGDERYAKEWLTQMDSWMRSNPVEFGVNWRCPMEVAIRLINWIWAYYFFCESPSLTNEARKKFLKAVILHSRFIFMNLENRGVRNNHYLANLAGLIYAGVLFPELKEAKRWLNFALPEIYKEIKHQFYSDGANFEASVSYHRLSLEIVISAILLLRLNNIQVPKEIYERLEKAFEFVAAYIKPDGTSPQIGDSDDGRLHILSEYTRSHMHDHRYLLAIGTVLFNRPDFAGTAGRLWEEAFWLLGNEGLEKFGKLDKNRINSMSRAFEDSGIYVMRRDDLYMVIDAGGNGQDGNGGHAHNDVLSFELYAYDKMFIVDPGTYVYTGDVMMRNKFRSTRFHNTMTVDGKEMNEIDGNSPFSLRSKALPKVLKWDTRADCDRFEGEYAGYGRLPKPLIHRRAIYFNKVEGYWVVKDFLIGEGEHKFDLYFHFGPMSVFIDEHNPLAVRTLCRGANLYLCAQEQKGLSLELIDGLVSYRYGKKEKAAVARYSMTTLAPAAFTVILSPFSSNIVKTNLEKSIECFEGRR